MKHRFISTVLKSAIALSLTTPAISDTFNASLSLVQPIALQESRQMDFGAILANDNVSCSLGTNGQRVGEACYGSKKGTLSSIALSGTEGMQVDIRLKPVGASSPDLFLMPVMVDNGQGSAALTGVTLTDNHSISLGGMLSIANGERVRNSNISSVDYQVEVTYQ